MPSQLRGRLFARILLLKLPAGQQRRVSYVSFPGPPLSLQRFGMQYIGTGWFCERLDAGEWTLSPCPSMNVGQTVFAGSPKSKQHRKPKRSQDRNQEISRHEKRSQKNSDDIGIPDWIDSKPSGLVYR